MQELADKFKALADKNRLKMVQLLLQKNYCVRALAEELEMSESAVSQHLKKLRQVGLVIGQKKGYWVHYTVQKEELKVLADDLTELAAQEQDQIDPCCHQ